MQRVSLFGSKASVVMQRVFEIRASATHVSTCGIALWAPTQFEFVYNTNDGIDAVRNDPWGWGPDSYGPDVLRRKLLLVRIPRRGRRPLL